MFTSITLSSVVSTHNSKSFSHRAASILRLRSGQALGEWAVWLQKHLQPTDAVVLEATTNAWTFYDQVAPHAGRTVVAHPGLVKVIASARVKTDNRDVLHRARLLAANLIPEVWVPPLAVRVFPVRAFEFDSWIQSV